MNYQALISAYFPELPIQTLTPVEEGWGSFVLEVNGEYIFRFPRRPEIHISLEKEIRLLPELAQALTLPVPQFEHIRCGGAGPIQSFVRYRKIPGVALSQDLLRSGLIARQLAEFLSELHKFPVERAVLLGIQAASPLEWRAGYVEFYAWVRQQVFPRVDQPAQEWTTRVWESFLNDPENFHFQPALIHADLGPEHVLCDLEQGCVTGIIDWEDAAIGDPALDFVGLYAVGGSDFVQQILDWYRVPVEESFWRRIQFYLSIFPFHEIRFGLYCGGEAHLEQGLQYLKGKD